MKSKAPEKLNIKKHYYELRVQPKLKLIQNWCKDGETRSYNMQKIRRRNFNFCKV